MAASLSTLERSADLGSAAETFSGRRRFHIPVMSRRIAIGALTAAVLVGVGALAFVNITAGRGSAADRSGLDWGVAGTNLGGTSGFTIRVTNVQRHALVNGKPYTVLNLMFANTSESQQRADPLDFTLTDGSGVNRQPIFAGHGDCAEWPRTDLYPKRDVGQPLRDAGGRAAGQTFGPATLCFQSEPSTSTLTLVWDPDVSLPFFDSPTRIPLH
jgi:hypothetical protein